MSCFWDRCDCPTQQPCPEHAGHFCSRWTTLQVTDAAQVNDGITRDAELAVTALDRDQARAREIRDQLLQRKAELEREHEALERELDQSSSFGQRRATANRLRRAGLRVAEIQKEIQPILAELNALSVNAFTAGAGLGAALITPYTSPTGYCECYAEKQRQLAALDDRVGSITTLEFNPVLAQYNFLITQARQSISLLPPADNIIRMVGSLSLAAAVVAFVISGWVAAGLTLVVGIVLTAAVIMSALVDLSRVETALLSARQHIVVTRLVAYREQEIATCQRAPATGAAAGRPPVFVNENAWAKKGRPDGRPAGEGAPDANISPGN